MRNQVEISVLRSFERHLHVVCGNLKRMGRNELFNIHAHQGAHEERTHYCAWGGDQQAEAVQPWDFIGGCLSCSIGYRVPWKTVQGLPNTKSAIYSSKKEQCIDLGLF